MNKLYFMTCHLSEISLCFKFACSRNESQNICLNVICVWKQDLNSRAHGEVTIREALRELELWGIGAVFSLTDYEDSQSRMIKLIKDWKDIVNQVGDNRCLLQSLKDSPYYKGFQDKVFVWEKKLAELDEYLQNLNQIQRKWVYLEPIFGRGALPREQARFNRVDEDFRSVLCCTMSFNPNISKHSSKWNNAKKYAKLILISCVFILRNRINSFITWMQLQQ